MRAKITSIKVNVPPTAEMMCATGEKDEGGELKTRCIIGWQCLLNEKVATDMLDWDPLSTISVLSLSVNWF